MLVRQGRIFAKDEITAVLLIREKHGKGELLIKECNVQPRKDLTWYEYVIDAVCIAPRYNDCPYQKVTVRLRPGKVYADKQGWERGIIIRRRENPWN